MHHDRNHSLPRRYDYLYRLIRFSFYFIFIYALDPNNNTTSLFIDYNTEIRGFYDI